MRIVALSDLHGKLPGDIPEGDVLVIAGDLCPTKADDIYSNIAAQQSWLDKLFSEWLKYAHTRTPEVILVAGNHDYIFESKNMLPNLDCTYLEDTSVKIDGVRFWGTPWVPNLPRWAFNASENMLRARADFIPSGVDVLISHGPPHGYGDKVGPLGLHSGQHVGDISLNDAIRRVRPKAFICGHIHDAHGHYEIPARSDKDPRRNLDIYNVSLLDDYYKLTYPPTVIDI